MQRTLSTLEANVAYLASKNVRYRDIAILLGIDRGTCYRMVHKLGLAYQVGAAQTPSMSRAELVRYLAESGIPVSRISALTWHRKVEGRAYSAPCNVLDILGLR